MGVARSFASMTHKLYYGRNIAIYTHVQERLSRTYGLCACCENFGTHVRQCVMVGYAHELYLHAGQSCAVVTNTQSLTVC